MIILRDKPGQLCNRLWAYSFFIAYGLNNDVKVYIPNFREYQSLFEDLEQFPKIRFHISKNKTFEKLIRLCILTIYLFEKVKLGFLFRIFNVHFPSRNLLDDQFCKGKSIVYINSWKQEKNVDAIKKYKPEIIGLFTPKKVFRDRPDALIADLRLRFDILVGVHIRRGDYSTFKGGIYYYDDKVYQKYMMHIKSQLAGKKVAFFISSNSTINPTEYEGLQVYQLENAQGIEDLYALSKCDYIMGPPSTFSMWASFSGSVPLKILESDDDHFTTDDFSVILYQNCFENGNKYS
jgi:hypothetical protein